MDNVPQTGPLNCVEMLLDRHLATDVADNTALLSGERCWTYRQLGDRVARIAQVMVEDFSILPGNRVMIRAANSPEAVAVWLAIQKIGAIAVTTMSLLRSAELAKILEIARPKLAVCESGLVKELARAAAHHEDDLAILEFGEDESALYDLMAGKSVQYPTCATHADDISLIGFTSGTTGNPKATIHFHRDILAICETVGRHILKPVPEDIFIGTAPLAFTFGLGGLLVFPLYFGAGAVLHGRYTPAEFLQAINRYRATICFTVPTYYQQMLRLSNFETLFAGEPALRMAVSSGEALPLPVREAWSDATGMDLTEVLGSTEMLHAFAGAAGEKIRAGCIGPAIPGFELCILDDEGAKLPPGEIGRLGVRGPTGCRYMDDPRQKSYVQYGWNLTGDACAISADGYVTYHTRYDDLIISSGYNISGLEVENVLLDHSQVSECAVIGEPDEQRGQVVAAFVVAKNNSAATEALAKELQDYVKAAIAPYKYPRNVRFVESLPRNESGKIQRFRLRG